MRIVDARELTVPLEGGVANAVVSFAGHTVSLVALVSDRLRGGAPVVGYGFNSIGRFAQGGILRERMLPRLLAAQPDDLLDPDNARLDPARVLATVLRNEKPGGHGDRAGAAGAIELATWDLIAKLADEPAYATIARRFNRRVEKPAAPVYAAGGYYYPDDSGARLTAELQGYRALGFEAFKIKIGGAPLTQDLERIDAAVAVAGSPARIAADANGRFDRASALDCAAALAPLGLRWFEEPGDPLDFELNCAVTERYPHPVATGENLFSAIDVRNLVRYGGMRPGQDVFQMDPGLSYGISEYAAMLDALEAGGFDRRQCQPHGGHLINLHVVVGLGLGGCEAYPGVFQPFGGYSPACRLEAGQVWPSAAAGFGLEQKSELAAHLAALR